MATSMSTTAKPKFFLDPPPGLLDRIVPIASNGMAVLERRYLRRGLDGNPSETVPEMFWRVASLVAAHSLGAEDKVALAVSYYDILTNIKFFPNSPTFTGTSIHLPMFFVHVYVLCIL